MSQKKIIPVPFLKWAGGKRQLLPELQKRMPVKYKRYFEPFIGGGALFFSLLPENSCILDINQDLIEAYLVVRDNVEELIEDLKEHKYEKDYYYFIRNLDRTAEFKHYSPIQKASRLIFLNKTCFNGLYRVNSKGEFNVPFGRYKNPKILNADNLRSCSEALKNTEIQQGDFTKIRDIITKDDFVYFDPPYIPLNTTSDFTAYTKEGFDYKEQLKLRDFCKELTEKDVPFLLSNSSAKPVLELYQDFQIEFIDASRAINANAAKRGVVKEVIITNYPCKQTRIRVK